MASDADTLTLDVINEGEPIPRSFRDQLFDPFRRGNNHRGHGLGLGLFIARSIAVAHNGDISFESDELLTRFHLRLPRS